MNSNIILIEEKILELKKYNGAIVFTFGDYYIQFNKKFGKRTFYCEVVSQNHLKTISQKQINLILKLNFKIQQNNFFKNYKTTEIDIILNEVKYIFSEIFNVDFYEKMSVENLIEYSTNPSIPSNTKSKKVQINRDNSSDNTLKIVGVLILIVLLISFISHTSSKNSQNNSKVESTSSDLSGKEIHSFITAEKFMKNELLSPKSAEFGYYDKAKVSFNGISTYHIKNFVDCENAYGVSIRHHFFITLDFKGGMWEDPNNWEVINLKIQ